MRDAIPVPMIAMVSPFFTESLEGAVFAEKSTASGFMGGSTPLESFFWAEHTSGLKPATDAINKEFKYWDFIINNAREQRTDR